jgi:hypothetical protein
MRITDRNKNRIRTEISWKKYDNLIEPQNYADRELKWHDIYIHND